MSSFRCKKKELRLEHATKSLKCIHIGTKSMAQECTTSLMTTVIVIAETNGPQPTSVLENLTTLSENMGGQLHDVVGMSSTMKVLFC